MVPTRELAAVGLLGSGDHLEQGGLACAVGADDPHDACGREDEREVFDEELVAEALGEVVGVDDLTTEAAVHGDLELEFVVGSFGRLVLGHELVVGGQAGLALGLAGLGRHAHPFELAFEGAGPGGVAAFSC